VRPIYLALATVAYWLGLALVKLSRPLLIAWRLSQLPPGQSSIEAGYSQSAFHLTMKQLDSVVWSGSISAGSLILWLLGPPALIIGGWWLNSQGADAESVADEAEGLSSTTRGPALPASGLPSSNVTRKISQEQPRKQGQPE
jgi:hypothetical protein